VASHNILNFDFIAVADVIFLITNKQFLLVLVGHIFEFAGFVEFDSHLINNETIAHFGINNLVRIDTTKYGFLKIGALKGEREFFGVFAKHFLYDTKRFLFLSPLKIKQ
jgi:hypothetical protein